MKGLLQSLDVRVKLLTFLFLLVLISFLHAPSRYGAFPASLSSSRLPRRIPPGIFLARVWLFVPLVSAAIVLPALLNIVTPGEPLWVVVTLDRRTPGGPISFRRRSPSPGRGSGGASFSSHGWVHRCPSRCCSP